MDRELKEGLRDGTAIGLGYFSVSFSFGILAVTGGLSAWQAGLISMSNLTSAGQFAGLTVIITGAGLLEMALTQFIINLRYALMSLSLSQRLGPEVGTLKRCLMAFSNTDEIFAVAMGRQGKLTPRYWLGLSTGPWLGWTCGTLTGALASQILPLSIRSALGLALYGMFIAIVMPAVRSESRVRPVVLAALTISCVLAWVPAFRSISPGLAIILATVGASALGAVLHPVSVEIKTPDSQKEEKQ